MSKSSSYRPRGLGRFRVSDDYRVLFPDHTPPSDRSAQYFLTSLGRVYRDDGLLLRPRAKDLRVKFNNGVVLKSVPVAVYKAFGRKAPKVGRVLHAGKSDVPVDPEDACWRPWVSPLAPIDDKTGRRSCATRYVKLAFAGDLIRLSHGTITPKQVKTMRIR